MFILCYSVFRLTYERKALLYWLSFSAPTFRTLT